jgi:hypothetical protein
MVDAESVDEEDENAGQESLQRTSFRTGSWRTSLARAAKLMVLRLSSKHSAAGVTVQMMQICALPPSEGCIRRVSFESR